MHISPHDLVFSFVVAEFFFLFSRFVIGTINGISTKGKSVIVLKMALKSELTITNLKNDAKASSIIAFISVCVDQVTGFGVPVLVVTLGHMKWFIQGRDSNPAVGLAWSFYFGYLKKILPRYDETVNKCKHKDFTIRKLFILVPVDCKIQHSLNKVDDRIRFQENLSPIVDTVAGIQSRKYTNSLYKIDAGDGETIYAAIEYATPLNTLREMCSHKEAGLTREERDHQAVVFYETIQKIIDTFSEEDDPSIKKNAVFVFLEENENIVDKILETARSMISD